MFGQGQQYRNGPPPAPLQQSLPPPPATQFQQPCPRPPPSQFQQTAPPPPTSAPFQQAPPRHPPPSQFQQTAPPPTSAPVQQPPPPPAPASFQQGLSPTRPPPPLAPSQGLRPPPRIQQGQPHMLPHRPPFHSQYPNGTPALPQQPLRPPVMMNTGRPYLHHPSPNYGLMRPPHSQQALAGIPHGQSMASHNSQYTTPLAPPTNGGPSPLPFPPPPPPPPPGHASHRNFPPPHPGAYHSPAPPPPPTASVVPANTAPVLQGLHGGAHAPPPPSPSPPLPSSPPPPPASPPPPPPPSIPVGDSIQVVEHEVYKSSKDHQIVGECGLVQSNDGALISGSANNYSNNVKVSSGLEPYMPAPPSNLVDNNDQKTGGLHENNATVAPPSSQQKTGSPQPVIMHYSLASDSDMDMEDVSPPVSPTASGSVAAAGNRETAEASPTKIHLPFSGYQNDSSSGAILTGGSPFRHIQGYASDDSSEDDKRNFFSDVSPVRVSPKAVQQISASRVTAFDPNHCASASTIPMEGVNKVSCKSSPHSEINRADTVSFCEDGQKSDEKKYTLNGNIVRDSDGDVDCKDGFKKETDAKSDPAMLKVDEFGRMIREGASDSDSDREQYKKRRNRSRSLSRSASPQGRRRRRSPRRRRDKRSRSRSWSPKRRRVRSRSPQADGGGFTRRGYGDPPQCKNFLRGRCYRGTSCKFLHNESGQHRNKYQKNQRSYQSSDKSEGHFLEEDYVVENTVENSKSTKYNNLPEEARAGHEFKSHGGIPKGSSEKSKPEISDNKAIIDYEKEDATHEESRVLDKYNDSQEVDRDPRSKRLVPNVESEQMSSALELQSHHLRQEDGAQLRSGDHHPISAKRIPNQGTSGDVEHSLSEVSNHLLSNKTSLPESSRGFTSPSRSMHQNLPTSHSECFPATQCSQSGREVPVQSAHPQHPEHSSQGQAPNFNITSQPYPNQVHSHPMHGVMPRPPSFSDSGHQPLSSQQAPTPFMAQPPYHPPYASQTNAPFLPSYQHSLASGYPSINGPPQPTWTNIPQPLHLAGTGRPIFPNSDLHPPHFPQNHSLKNELPPQPSMHLSREDPTGSKDAGVQNIQQVNDSGQMRSIVDQQVQTFGHPASSYPYPQHPGLLQPSGGSMRPAIGMALVGPPPPSSWHSSTLPGNNSQFGLTDSAQPILPSSQYNPLPPNYAHMPAGSVLASSHSKLISNSYPQDTMVSSSFRKQHGSKMPAENQYDPLFDSIEASSSIVKTNPLLDKDPVQSANAAAINLESDEFGETATDAEVGAVEDGSPILSDDKEWSPGVQADMIKSAAREVDIDNIPSPGKARKGKDSRSMKLFKASIANFVKEVLKPSWRQGNMSKEAFKTIVKKTVEKVSSSMPSRRVPKTKLKIDQYVESSQRKLTKLVMGYVDKYVKV